MVVLEVVVPVTLLPQVVEQQTKATQVALEIQVLYLGVAVVVALEKLGFQVPLGRPVVLVLPLLLQVQA
jgi:hypothetical protein